MVTLVENGVIAKYIGLSTDVKPLSVSSNSGMPNGSKYKEMDTGDEWYYNADSSAWVKQSAGNDSESDDSDSSASGVLVVTDTEGTLDKTLGELKEASLAVMKIDYTDSDGDIVNFFMSEIATENDDISTYIVKFRALAPDISVREYYAESDDDYPVYD